jgi:hypothetical protein
LAKGNLVNGKKGLDTVAKKEAFASLKKTNGVAVLKTTVKKTSNLVPKTIEKKKLTASQPTKSSSQRRKSSSGGRSAKVKSASEIKVLPEVSVAVEEEVPEPEYMPPSVNLKGT